MEIRLFILMHKLFLFQFFVVLFTFTSSSQAEKTRVLYLGDSLSLGGFGKTLDSGLRSEGVELYTVIAGGASPYYWLKAYQTLPCTIGFWEKSPITERKVGYVRAVPKMEDMIEEHSPQFVVVQTGINLYATLRSRRQPKEDNILEIRTLIDQMSHSIAKAGAAAYWIMPPHSHESRYSLELQKELSDIMRSVIKEYNGEIFESSEVTRYTDPYPANDGIHFGHEQAAAWGEKVRDDLLVFIHEKKGGKPQSNKMTMVPLVPSHAVEVASIDPTAAHESSAPAASIQKAEVAPSTPPIPVAIAITPDKPAIAAAPDKPAVAEKAVPGLNAGAGGIQEFDRLDLELRLVAKSEITNISEIDYANALGVFEYEVIKDRLGNYPLPRVRVAHGIVFRRKFTSAATKPIGSTTSLKLVPLSAYKNLQTWQTADDLRPDFEMPLYTPKLD